MSLELYTVAAGLWCIGVLCALSGSEKLLALARALLGTGCVVAMLAAIHVLPDSVPAAVLPVRLAGQPVTFRLDGAALWLLGFGLAPAALACWLGTPARAPRSQSAWLAGAGLSLLGALGVFGLQDAVSFLIAWELMSLGGAVMILGEGLSRHSGASTLFMLGLLEVGAVALLLAFLILDHAGGPGFERFAVAAVHLKPGALFFIGALLLFGFGAKLGLLPFYEWFPGAYGSGSGASGALLSGVILNAAFFSLARGLVQWLPAQAAGSFGVSVLVIAAGAVSAVLAILYAFQQEDWRGLLSFSSAENAAVAVTALGACLMFRQASEPALAALAWTVALLHMAAHSLAKGTLFLTADGVYRGSGNYTIAQGGLLRRGAWPFGVGALFAAMSLAAMPPQAGFVSEWYVFQTLFQGFHLPDLPGRLTLALAGAGLALTAAVALATFVKVFGVGLLGDGRHEGSGLPRATGAAVFLLGLGVLALAVGMPWWLGALGPADLARFGVDGAARMRDGWLLVPLTAKFAFISPTKLMLAAPLLALIPLGLLLSARRFPIRRARVWYGGARETPRHAATTALTFSNALRTFYSFIYRPTHVSTREYEGKPYFLKRLVFNHEVAPIFGPYLFSPVTKAVWKLAGKIRILQSGYLNFYTALIGALLVIILSLAFF